LFYSYCAKTGRVVLLNGSHSIERDWRFDPEIDRRPGLTIESCLIVPVRNYTGQTIGVLEAINSRNGQKMDITSADQYGVEPPNPDPASASSDLPPSTSKTSDAHSSADNVTSFSFNSSHTPSSLPTLVSGLGVLNNQLTVNGGCFNDQEEMLLKSISLFIATVLRKSELEAETMHRRKQADALMQVAELTSADFGVKRAVQRILRASNMVLNCCCEVLQFFVVVCCFCFSVYACVQ
jgi:GAF domain-containing protein